MRDYKTSNIFEKNIKNLKRQDMINLLNKIDEICSIEDLNHYKNLRHDSNKFKRVHVNNSFIVLFFGDDNLVYFVDYDSHDKIYKVDKKQSKKYENLEF